VRIQLLQIEDDGSLVLSSVPLNFPGPTAIPYHPVYEPPEFDLGPPVEPLGAQTTTFFYTPSDFLFAQHLEDEEDEEDEQ
jgi:hypothetical protein